MELRSRLESLKEELSKGEQMLADLDRRRQEIRDQMLRIGGAIQVLTEVLNERAQPVPVPRHASAGD
jgi:prefoldin subunit 5